MNLNLAVVCDHAMVDQQGKLSIVGIFQNVWVARFPALHPRLHLVMRLQGKRTEVGRHDIEIKFTGPDGESLISGNGSVTFNEPPAGVVDIEANAIVVFDVPLPKAGQYQFAITVDNQLETTVPLTAMQANQSASGGATNLN